MNSAENRLEGKYVNPRYEIKIISKSGKTKVLDANITLIKFRGENAILASCLDISKQIRVKNELIKSKNIIEAKKNSL